MTPPRPGASLSGYELSVLMGLFGSKRPGEGFEGTALLQAFLRSRRHGGRMWDVEDLATALHGHPHIHISRSSSGRTVLFRRR